MGKIKGCGCKWDVSEKQDVGESGMWVKEQDVGESGMWVKVGCGECEMWKE